MRSSTTDEWSCRRWEPMRQDRLGLARRARAHTRRLDDLGQAVVEVLFRLRSHPNLQRRPDLAFVSFDRWPGASGRPRSNAWEVVPDLVVEVVSPTNLAEEIPTGSASISRRASGGPG